MITTGSVTPKYRLISTLHRVNSGPYLSTQSLEQKSYLKEHKGKISPKKEGVTYVVSTPTNRYEKSLYKCSPNKKKKGIT